MGKIIYRNWKRLLSDYIKKFVRSSNRPGKKQRKFPKREKPDKNISHTTELRKEKPDEKIINENNSETKTEKIEENPIEKIEEKTDLSGYSDEFLNLFEEETSKELSEKLGRRPISDLKKAFGINEKIFTVRELFGGSKELFDKTIETLNGLSDFNEAKIFILKNIANDNNWDSKSNQSRSVYNCQKKIYK